MECFSVVIPFLNEGDEVKKTLLSLHEKSKLQNEYIVINDNSEDEYDYSEISEIPNVKYVLNKVRLGVAASRDLGVNLASNENIILLDAHMRALNNDWDTKLLKRIENNKRAIYCCTCTPLLENDTTDDTKNIFAGVLRFSGDHYKDILEAKWLKEYRTGYAENNEITCILGASYVFDKSYWQYLKGLNGLLTYGSDEVYISLKAWMEGGKCILIDDIVFAHKFRSDGKQPYFQSAIDVVYNKILISKLLLPVEIDKLINAQLEIDNYKLYKLALKQFKKNKRKVFSPLKKYYMQILKEENFRKFYQYNKGFS